MQIPSSDTDPSAYTGSGTQAPRLVLVIIACLLLEGASMRAPCSATETIGDERAAPVEQRSQSIIKAVSEAIVRINLPSKEATTGVIVSDQGHVIWRGMSHSMAELSVVLPNGAAVQAINLGWSEEWRVGLLKLKGDRKWPRVERGTTVQSKSGDRIFEIGYHAKKAKDGEFDCVTRSGKLTLVSPSHWFATDLPPTHFEYGAGTFDTNGKLLGISVPGTSRVHPVATAIDIVISHWADFADGKSLDWVRFPPSKDSLYRCLGAPEQLDRIGFIPRENVPIWKDAKASMAVDEKVFRDARKVAAETTVRIRLRAPIEPGRKSHKSTFWSGVLISKDGLIATCAHTEQVAGEELVVVMPDSRELPAVSFGTNWVSDLGMVKITEKGSWSHAKLGDSSVIGPLDAVLCAGFPAPDTTPLAPVTMDMVPLQRTPFIGWNHELVLNLSEKLMGGTSGGGVFDREGKLVAIYIGPGVGHRIEMFRTQMEYLKQENAMIGHSIPK